MEISAIVHHVYICVQILYPLVVYYKAIIDVGRKYIGKPPITCKPLSDTSLKDCVAVIGIDVSNRSPRCLVVCGFSTNIRL